MQRKIKKRAKAPEKKAKQFEEIIKVGKEMLAKYGTRGLSIRAIAKKLGMAQTNLYNYIESKRELWIVIRSSYYNEFLHPLDNLIKKHNGTYNDLFIKISEFFLEFANEDYNRFEIMFLISAPKSSKEGRFEKAYEPFQITKRLLELVKKSIDVYNVDRDEIIKIFYYNFGLLIGTAKMEADLKDHFHITEPFDIKTHIKSTQEYRQFVLKSIRKNLESYLPK